MSQPAGGAEIGYVGLIKIRPARKPSFSPRGLGQQAAPAFGHLRQELLVSCGSCRTRFRGEGPGAAMSLSAGSDQGFKVSRGAGQATHSGGWALANPGSAVAC